MSTITGNTEFNDCNNNGTVVGQAVFTGDSTNNGVIEGNAAFYDTAINSGEIVGAAAFLDDSQNNGDIGSECNTAPVIVQQPESVYAGPGGLSNAPMLFSVSTSDFTTAGFSIIAEENPWINVGWTIAATYGYNQVSTFFVSGSYEDKKDLNIGSIGGLPGEIYYATINCKLDNPIGEVQANEVFFIKGDLPSITQESNQGIINLTEGEPLSFPFAAFSWASSVIVGLSNGSTINDPLIGESEFNTEFDVDSLNNRRKIALTYFNLNRAATLEDNNVTWWFRIRDVFGTSIAPNEIRTYVTPAQT